MSNYKPYRAYKDSGVEWIGQVPEHWEVAPLKRLAQVVNGATPESGISAYWDGDIAWFTPADLDNENATELIEPRRKITLDGLESCAARLTPPGSVVLSTRAPVGSVGITQTPSATNQGCRTLVPTGAIPPKLLAEILVAARSELALRSNGTTFQELSTDALASLRVPLPPPAEQTAIAVALDRETARIDALIAKKTRFIELLKEKRQALITHAVTKGLNPKVKMKDSGVAWIGEMPEHWEVVQSRRMFSERRERARPGDLQFTASQKYGVIPQSEFMEREQRQVMLVVKGQEILKHIEPGDFLISMRSFEGGLEECTGAGSVSSAYVPLTPIKWVWNPFFRYLFKCSSYIQALQATSDLVRDGQALRFENFSKVPLPGVPPQEQRVIAAHLDRGVARIDALTSKTEQSIALLKERRSALIAAAVTGQIDLREAA